MKFSINSDITKWDEMRWDEIITIIIIREREREKDFQYINNCYSVVVVVAKNTKWKKFRLIALLFWTHSTNFFPKQKNFQNFSHQIDHIDIDIDIDIDSFIHLKQWKINTIIIINKYGTCHFILSKYCTKRLIRINCIRNFSNFDFAYSIIIS